MYYGDKLTQHNMISNEGHGCQKYFVKQKVSLNGSLLYGEFTVRYKTRKVHIL